MVGLYKSMLWAAAVVCLFCLGVEANNREWRMGFDGRSDPNACKQLRGSCRFECGKFTTDKQNEQSYFNISCDCSTQDEKDASPDLEQLVTLPCSGKPDYDDMTVNVSAISIKACRLNEPFPDKMVAMARRSENLEINIQDAPRFRMKNHHSPSRHIVPKITATFSNSALSGLASGWFTGTRDLELKIDGCTVDVVESKALRGFPPEAVTNIQITNSNLTTIKMSAMELPADSTFKMDKCTVKAWNDSAFLGGRALFLSNLRVIRMLRNGINIRGLESFKLYNSTILELTAEAIIDRQMAAMPRNDRNDQRVPLADVSGNTFIRANGEAFVHLCQVEDLIFKNNQFMDISQPPLRLCPNINGESANTNQDWDRVFKNNGLPCNNCSDFSVDNNKQVCSMYTSSHCTCSSSNDSKISSCQDGASLTMTVYDACYIKTECEKSSAAAAVAVTAASTTTNDALSLPGASSFILGILIMVQIGLMIYV